MKFLHAADIHLDSPLAGLLARDDLPDVVIRHCTRRAFAAMIDLALEEDVAFVVIAGDLYDGDWKDFSTGLFFAEQMRRLCRPCFLLRGNHDARSLITRHLKLPDICSPSSASRYTGIRSRTGRSRRICRRATATALTAWSTLVCFTPQPKIPANTRPTHPAASPR